MREDAYGNSVTTDRPETVEAIDRFAASYIGYGTDFGIIFEAADADPDCLLAQAHALLLAELMEAPEREGLIARYRERLGPAAARATERERLYAEAVEAAATGDISTALGRHERIARDSPDDLFSAKLGQTHYFNIGDAEGMLRLADRLGDRHKQEGYFHGMRAFALEQSHRLQEAEEAARTAIDLRGKEPWAHHALAHVMLTEGRIDEGASWMASHAHAWEGCNSFMYTHNWWHLALFHLERDDYATVLDLYARRVWGVDKTFSQDQINAISLLWRLEMDGVDPGERWDDLAAHVQERHLVHDQPFLDVQYVYALARAGLDEDCDDFIAGMEAKAVSAAPTVRQAWGEVAVPMAKGCVAFAHRRHAEACRYMEPAMSRLASIGGSHAQRDLFEQTWLVSLLHAGRHEEALPALKTRAMTWDGVARNWRRLTEAYLALGDYGNAEIARSHLRELMPDDE